jgi:excisionase family DNA binding protein
MEKEVGGYMRFNDCGLADEIRERTALLDALEVAELLRISKETVYKWAKRHALPCIRFGKDCIRFDPKQLADWIQSNGEPAATAETEER